MNPAARNEAFAHLCRYFSVRRRPHFASPGQPFAAQWSVEVELLINGRLELTDLTILLPHDFPLSLPKLTLPRARVEALNYPLNVGADGIVCTFDASTTTPNPDAPGPLLEACVRKAVEILERDLSGPDVEAAYEEEFLAYWEERYAAEPAVDTQVLSLVDEGSGLIEQATLVRLHRRFGPYHSVIYSTQASFDKLATTLEAKGIFYKAEPTFYLGELDVGRPPYGVTNGEVFKLLGNLGQTSAFKSYLARCEREPVVTFSKHVKGRHLVFGWRHQALVPRTSGRHHKRKSKKRLAPHQFLQRDRYMYAERFSPQVLTDDRLRQRTAADYRSSTPPPGSFLFAGLGSVGSQLLRLLAATVWREMYLIDPDVFTLENSGRHLLGLEQVGMFKVDGLRAYLLNKNPLGSVHTFSHGIVEAVTRDPALLSAPDYLFACTGDVNAETWLSRAQARGDVKRPIFFVWVEPYLSGGHCVLIKPGGDTTLENLYDGSYYRHNVIPPAEHGRRVFTKREAGCQTAYVPYSNALLMDFLARLLPEILRIFRVPDHPSCRFTWTGDLCAAEQLGITTSDEAHQAGSFHLTKAYLS